MREVVVVEGGVEGKSSRDTKVSRGGMQKGHAHREGGREEGGGGGDRNRQVELFYTYLSHMSGGEGGQRRGTVTRE